MCSSLQAVYKYPDSLITNVTGQTNVGKNKDIEVWYKNVEYPKNTALALVEQGPSLLSVEAKLAPSDVGLASDQSSPVASNIQVGDIKKFESEKK